MKKGRELQEKWQLSEEGFLPCVTRYGLPPYDVFGEPVSTEILQKRIAGLIARHEQITSLCPHFTTAQILKLNSDQAHALKYIFDRRSDLPRELAAIAEEVLDYFYKDEDVERFEELYPNLVGSIAAESGNLIVTTSESLAVAPKQKTGQAKETFRAYAKGVIESGDIPTRAALAERILNALPDVTNPKTGKPYDSATVIDWIRDLFPDYEPLKPGAKPKK